MENVYALAAGVEEAVVGLGLALRWKVCGLVLEVSGVRAHPQHQRGPGRAGKDKAQIRKFSTHVRVKVTPVQLPQGIATAHATAHLRPRPGVEQSGRSERAGGGSFVLRWTGQKCEQVRGFWFLRRNRSGGERERSRAAQQGSRVWLM